MGNGGELLVAAFRFVSSFGLRFNLFNYLDRLFFLDRLSDLGLLGLKLGRSCGSLVCLLLCSLGKGCGCWYTFNFFNLGYYWFILLAIFFLVFTITRLLTSDTLVIGHLKVVIGRTLLRELSFILKLIELGDRFLVSTSWLGVSDVERILEESDRCHSVCGQNLVQRELSHLF